MIEFKSDIAAWWGKEYLPEICECFSWRLGFQSIINQLTYYMLLIKAMWFGCKHVAYNLELSVQLGSRIGRL